MVSRAENSAVASGGGSGAGSKAFEAAAVAVPAVAGACVGAAGTSLDSLVLGASVGAEGGALLDTGVAAASSTPVAACAGGTGCSATTGGTTTSVVIGSFKISAAAIRPSSCADGGLVERQNHTVKRTIIPASEHKPTTMSFKLDSGLTAPSVLAGTEGATVVVEGVVLDVEDAAVVEAATVVVVVSDVGGATRTCTEVVVDDDEDRGWVVVERGTEVVGRRVVGVDVGTVEGVVVGDDVGGLVGVDEAGGVVVVDWPRANGAKATDRLTAPR